MMDLPDHDQKNIPEGDGNTSPASWKRFIPLLVLGAGLCLILSVMWYYDIRLDQQFWVNIADRYDILTQWIEQRYLMMSIAFIAGYTIAVAFSVPGAVFLTLLGGALFGWMAVIMVVFSASLGALLVFLAARGACASFFQASGSRFINRLKNGFDKSPFFWLLALRLMPVAPFWVVNIISAMLGIRVFPYLMATV
ncbi:MAG: TVP38/TMEM64 family protein, partial [Candidatus Puniceispirillales bacterium]